MSDNKRIISVFFASPGDLSAERRVFREVIFELNDGFGDGARVEFEPLGWEDTLAFTGRRVQGVINKEIDRCDVFILAMHKRWGREAPDARPYTSYTEEEFHRALERWKNEGSPEIFIFFKRVNVASEADPDSELKKVIAFKQHLEDTRQIRYDTFNEEQSFAGKINKQLRAYAKGELPKVDEKRDKVLLPASALKEVEKAKAAAAQKAEEAARAHDDKEKARMKIKELQLQLAEDAANLSKEGKIEFAREKFAKLFFETSDTRILYLAFGFFFAPVIWIPH